MISLTPIIAALKPRQVLPGRLPWFRQVEGAAAFARVAELPSVPLPGCWVIRTSDTSTPDGERASLVRVGFDVVVAITNHRIDSTGDSDDVLLSYRDAVLAVLQDFKAFPNVTLKERVARKSGQAIEYAAGDLWWRDAYEFTARVTNYLPDPPAFEQIQNRNT